MIRSYKYRIYPNATQTAQLERVLDVACRVYNDMLHTARLWYEDDVKWNTKTKRALRDMFTAARRQHACIQETMPAATVDALTYRVDGAMRAFFALRKNGHADAMPPKAVKRSKFRSIPYWAGSGAKLIEDYEGVARLRIWSAEGLIRVHYHRPIPERFTIKQYILMKSGADKWYVVLQSQDKAFEAVPSDKPAIGIDVGMYSLLALSDGTLYDNPRWYRQDLKRRRILQRKADRQRRASNPDNYNEDGTVKENTVIWRKSNRLRETERLLRKMDAKIKDQRKHYWHVVTDELTKRFGLIAIEDLTLDFMIQNKRLAISVHDASFATFWQMLEYKCHERGVELVRVPPQYTSQICSGCGEIVKKSLAVRTHRCACGLEIDRDVNAAINILNSAVNGAVQSPRGETQANRSNVPCKAQSEYPVATGGVQQ